MSTTIHRFTSAHRLAGGLRRVAFVLSRIELQKSKSGHPLKVVVMGWQQGSIALPLLDAGYDVTLIENNADIRREALQVASECGLKLAVLSESALEREDVAFDGAVIDVDRQETTQTALAVLRPHLSSGAVAYIAGTQDPSFLFSAGWRLQEAISTVAFASTLGRRSSKSAGWQNAIESIMVRLIPFRRSAGWIVEATPCDPERPYVLQLMPSFGVGGAEKVVLDLASGLRAKGFETGVIATICGGDLEAAFRERGISTRVLRRRDRIGVSTLFDLVHLFRLERPTVVHTHLFGADLWGRLAAFIAGVPIVITTEHNTNPGYSFFHRTMNRLLATRTSAIVAVSEAATQVSLAQDHVPSQKIQVIPNAIDITRVIPRGGHGFRDIPRILIAALLYPQKDHATLLKALALINRPWRLLVAGDGPLKQQLVDLASRLEIASRVEWLGVRHDIPQLLAHADLFCFPSRWEGLGNAVLEAAAAGVPVVCSDLPPLHEVFEETDVAFVAPGDVPAWTHAIQDILDNPSEAITRAARLAPRVLAESSLDQMIDAYAALYRSFFHV